MSTPQDMDTFMGDLAQDRKNAILSDLESFGYRLAYFGAIFGPGWDESDRAQKMGQRVQGLKWDGERNGLTDDDMNAALERGKADGLADAA